MASSSSGCHGAATAKHRCVLLRFTRDSLRIPDELAAEIAAEEALVVGSHSKVWRVGIGWDGDGALLGRGWRAFAAACGVESGWFLVLRHRSRGLLTLKAFDDDRCLTELGAQTTAPAVEATTNYKGASRKPQFINVFPTKSMGKMLIPARFAQHYIPKDHLNNRMVIISGPLGKACPIELEMNQSSMFFAGGWSQFMAFHGITEADALLLRYEGNMAFTVKVFGPDRCQRESMHKDGRMQQNELEITSTLPDTERQLAAGNLFCFQ
nr:putative B3 domain-containing protein Os04g0347400 [Setaria viridis]